MLVFVWQSGIFLNLCHFLKGTKIQQAKSVLRVVPAFSPHTNSEAKIVLDVTPKSLTMQFDSLCGSILIFILFHVLVSMTHTEVIAVRNTAKDEWTSKKLSLVLSCLRIQFTHETLCMLILF